MARNMMSSGDESWNQWSAGRRAVGDPGYMDGTAQATTQVPDSAVAGQRFMASAPDQSQRQGASAPAAGSAASAPSVPVGARVTRKIMRTDPNTGEVVNETISYVHRGDDQKLRNRESQQDLQALKLSTGFGSERQRESSRKIMQLRDDETNRQFQAGESWTNAAPGMVQGMAAAQGQIGAERIKAAAAGDVARVEGQTRRDVAATEGDALKESSKNGLQSFARGVDVGQGNRTMEGQESERAQRMREEEARSRQREQMRIAADQERAAAMRSGNWVTTKNDDQGNSYYHIAGDFDENGAPAYRPIPKDRSGLPPGLFADSQSAAAPSSAAQEQQPESRLAKYKRTGIVAKG